MRRREFIAGLTLPLLARGARAQQPVKVWRIGVLATASRPDTLSTFGGFLEGMRELGYAEGRDLIIEWRFAEGRFERLPDLAADLVRLKVDVIVAGVNVTIAAAKEATSTIPIVMILAPDPVATGFVTSLAHPGGNITGLSNSAREYGSRQFELLANAVPNLKRVGVFFDPANLFKGLDPFATIEVAGRRLDIAVVFFDPDPGRIEEAFQAMSQARIQGAMVFTGLGLFGHREKVAQLAIAHGLALMGHSREWVLAGALMSYGQNVRDSFRQAASYVDRILKGVSPADLPVQQPTKFDIVINLKTAKALGLIVPTTLLTQADEVIE
jgi:putative ABC transport system substrate-binding protein